MKTITTLFLTLLSVSVLAGDAWQFQLPTPNISNHYAGSFSGNGAGLTNLSGTGVTYTNNNNPAGVVVGSGIGTNQTASAAGITNLQRGVNLTGFSSSNGPANFYLDTTNTVFRILNTNGAVIVAIASNCVAIGGPHISGYLLNITGNGRATAFRATGNLDAHNGDITMNAASGDVGWIQTGNGTTNTRVSITSTGLLSQAGYISALSTNVTISSTSNWTNTTGKNVFAYVTATAVALKNAAATTQVDFGAAATTISVAMQPNWYLTGTSIVGTAVGW